MMPYLNKGICLFYIMGIPHMLKKQYMRRIIIIEPKVYGKITSTENANRVV